MKRALFSMLVTVSALLFAAVVTDWIRSIIYSETLILVRGSHVYAIDNYNGEVAFWRGRFRPGEAYPDGLYMEHWKRPNASTTLQFSIDNPTGDEYAFAGFVITQQRHIPTTITQTFSPSIVTDHLGIAVPSWFLTLLFGALPGMQTYRWIRGLRRHKEGFCPTCGYDLRASTDRCPECGSPISQAAEAAQGRQTLS